MLQEGKQALDDEMDNQYGAIETKGQVVASCGEKLVAHYVGRGDAHQNGYTKNGGHKYPQVGEDFLVPHLRRNFKDKDKLLVRISTQSENKNCLDVESVVDLFKNLDFLHYLLVKSIYIVYRILKHNYSPIPAYSIILNDTKTAYLQVLSMLPIGTHPVSECSKPLFFSFSPLSFLLPLPKISV